MDNIWSYLFEISIIAVSNNSTYPRADCGFDDLVVNNV